MFFFHTWVTPFSFRKKRKYIISHVRIIILLYKLIIKIAGIISRRVIFSVLAFVKIQIQGVQSHASLLYYPTKPNRGRNMITFRIIAPVGATFTGEPF